MKTLQELLQMKVKSKNLNGEEVEVSPDFRIAVQGVYDFGRDGVRIIVHPMNHNGDTLDLLVKGNVLSPVFPRPANPPGENKPRGPWEPLDPARQCG